LATARCYPTKRDLCERFTVFNDDGLFPCEKQVNIQGGGGVSLGDE
jgi:hypothetical protein